MESASSTPTETATTGTAPAAAEERKQEEMVHKTKLIQFLGRTSPIILQNDNGPCPLLAICNVLLLRNCLNMSPEVSEVSQEKLLSLVAERLIDTNINDNNKDAAYVENQQQNISDAIDLLPRLMTGIDVNIKFGRIDDFEFTRECAIFDLLDIPLYHGWIVDPQDHETANAIGSKSYNTLMGELVALETQNMRSENQKNTEEHSVDITAASAAELVVPSPCLFNGPPVPEPETQSSVSITESNKARKGDLLEEAELMRVLKLSNVETVSTSADDVSMEKANSSSSPKKSPFHGGSRPDALADASKGQSHETNSTEHEASTTNDSRVLSGDSGNEGHSEMLSEEAVCLSGKPNLENQHVESASSESRVVIQKPGFDSKVKDESTLVESKENISTASGTNGHTPSADGDQPTNIAKACDVEKKQDATNRLGTSSAGPVEDSKSSSSDSSNLNEPEVFASTIDGDEPIYKGDVRLMNAETGMSENREPFNESEVVREEQDDNSASEANSKSEMTIKQGNLIHSFLKSSASQLTVYGLFCLQDGIKERELCVFFRNNHFNTMFKFEGELYILITDQGYINQPDLVWEKLNEVNGDTSYMTGNFKEFTVDDHSNSAWDEQNSMASTADYLASVDTSAQEHSSFHSDLQLAMALQQQEYEQQQSQRKNDTQKQPMTSTSRLVTGPKVSRNTGKHTSSSSRQDSKSSKDRCNVM